MSTVLAASETAASNKIMLRTTAEELIVRGQQGDRREGHPV